MRWPYHVIHHDLQFSSVAQSRPTLCDPIDCSTPGLPVHHQLLELAQTQVHQVGDAIQPSHLLSPSPPAFNLSQHQGLFQWVSSFHQVAKWSYHTIKLGKSRPRGINYAFKKSSYPISPFNQLNITAPQKKRNKGKEKAVESNILNKETMRFLKTKFISLDKKKRKGAGSKFSGSFQLGLNSKPLQ